MKHHRRMTAISALLLISVLLVVLRVNCRTDYEELYRSNEYLSGLPSLITRCSMDPEYERENKLECSVADYISRISKAHNTLLTTPATVLTPSITIVKKPLSYEKLFSDYISENQPVTSQVEVQMAHTALEIVQKCGDGFTGSLAKCKEYQSILETFVIPKVAANNYLFRLPSAAEAIDNTENSENKNGLDGDNYRMLWPAVLSIDAADTPVVQTCPQQMHMLVWGASSALRARVFHESAARHFHPTVGAGISSSSGPGSGIGSSSGIDDGSGIGSDSGSGSHDTDLESGSGSDIDTLVDPGVGSGSGIGSSSSGKNNIPLHVTTYIGSGYPKISLLQAEIDSLKTNINPPKKTPRFAEITLKDAGDYLFIPSNHMVSFYPFGVSEDDIDEMREIMGGNEKEGGGREGSSFLFISSVFCRRIEFE